MSSISIVQYGCLVVNAPTANTVAAAEHGIALICALSRNVAQADASVKRGEWKRAQYTGVSLVNKTLAIMGFGKVGQLRPVKAARVCVTCDSTCAAHTQAIQPLSHVCLHMQVSQL